MAGDEWGRDRSRLTDVRWTTRHEDMSSGYRPIWSVESSDKDEKKAHRPATLATPIVPVPDATEGVWWPRNLNGSFVSWEQLVGARRR
jgi:hypothetical protein